MVLNKKIVLGILILLFFVIKIVPVCGQSDFGSEEVFQNGFNFYAEYDRLVDTDSHKIRIYHAALSGDGTRLAFSGENIDNGNLVLYTVNADGSDLSLIPIPSELQGIDDLVIDEDGSRAFFRDRWFHLIYKVEDGALTQILDTNDYPEINGVWKIQTTADGEYVYFMEDRDDLWRLRHSGGTPELVIEDTEVSRVDSKGNKAWAVNNFAISNDASTIAFILSGYYDPTNYYGASLKHELFVSHMGKYKQLTNDAVDVGKTDMDISGDGTIIAFSSAESPQARWYSIHSDGSSKITVENAGFNVGGVSLTYDGTKMFYSDALANGGRLVNTDGSGGIDLFPNSNVATIVLSATWDPCISDDGRRVSFRFGYSSWPFKEALYIGYLNDPGAVPDAPVIDSIAFNPPSMPRGDPDARVILTSKISDPQGLADIERTSTDPLLDGRLESGPDCPAYFPFAAHDDGHGVDERAGDGIYSTEGKPGGKIDELDRMTVRMGAMDSSKTVVVADTVLPIGGAPIHTETPTITVVPEDSNFYAEYDRLVDTDSHKIRIYHAALSGDGTRLAFSGENIDNGNLVLYTVNADGSDLSLIPIPSELQGIDNLVIDEDGSRAFFRDRWFHLIYKVEDGALTQILDTNDYPEINGVWKIQTTADGEYVYFMEDRDDLWRLRHSGGTPELVIEDTEVSRVDSKGNKAWAVNNFAISNDASTIAFILSGYYDPTNYYGASLKHELFVSHMGKYKQLTNDAVDVGKTDMDISGDGTIIAFSSAESPQARWYSIHSDGSSKITVENAGFNVGGVSLTYDGTKMFYSDALANGGRLVNTDGSGGIDLFPNSNVATIVLSATWDPCISDDGRRVSFRFGYSSWPFKEALYIGYLNDPGAVPDAPVIDSIAFNPPSMPRGDPDARVILTSKISDPQGLADIERTSTDPLLDGRLESGPDCPAYFPFAAHDDGHGVDERAGDGIYSTEGKPGGKIDELDRMTVRMGAMDSSKTVVVADTVLPIGGAPIQSIELIEIATAENNGMFTVTKEASPSGDASILALAITAIIVALFMIKKRK